MIAMAISTDRRNGTFAAKPQALLTAQTDHIEYLGPLMQDSPLKVGIESVMRQCPTPARLARVASPFRSPACAEPVLGAVADPSCEARCCGQAEDCVARRPLRWQVGSISQRPVI